MKLTMIEVSEASGVSVGKVKMDVSRGKLDIGSLRDVCGYVVACLLMQGVERVCGMVPAEAIIPVGAGAGSVPEGKAVAVRALEHPAKQWTASELAAIAFMMKSGTSKVAAECRIVKARENLGVESISEDDAAELGW